MPGFVHHTLFVAFGERQHEVIPGRMVLQPAKGCGVLKALGEVGLRKTAIAEIHGITGAVLGVAGWSRNLSSFFGGLVPFGGHVKKDRFLEGQGTKSAEQTQINPVSRGGSHHRVEGIGGLHIQLNPWLKDDELIGIRFVIGEVTQETAVGVGTFAKA